MINLNIEIEKSEQTVCAAKGFKDCSTKFDNAKLLSFSILLSWGVSGSLFVIKQDLARNLDENFAVVA